MEKHIKEMRVLAKQLAKYSFPLKSAIEDEEISCLKQREIALDGYDLMLYNSINQYNKIELESVHIFGKYFTFLPFHLVCKVGISFLGNKELSLFELYRGEKEMLRKIYVWSVYYNETGETIKNLSSGKIRNFQGFDYIHIIV